MIRVVKKIFPNDGSIVLMLLALLLLGSMLSLGLCEDKVSNDSMFITTADWSKLTPIAVQLGYEDWIDPNAESPIIHYLVTRTWHLVPLFLNIFSLLFF